MCVRPGKYAVRQMHTWYYQQCTAAAWYVRVTHTAPTAVVLLLLHVPIMH